MVSGARQSIRDERGDTQQFVSRRAAEFSNQSAYLFVAYPVNRISDEQWSLAVNQWKENFTRLTGR